MKFEEAFDAEYVIKQDGESTDTLIIGVLSKSLNASSWLRINNDYLSKCTTESLLKDLRGMAKSMVYQKNNNLLHPSV